MGVFVAIEGGDGSGKATQALELETRAIKEGYDVLAVSFPQYGEPSAEFIEHYLNGKYGPANSVHPELASMLYALDRYVASDKIREHLAKPNSLVIADRYVASNLAHQGTKFSSDKERHDFYDTILSLEYGTFDLPRPDLNIVLLVPSDIAQDNIERKPARFYTEATHDIHEADATHLERASANYRELARLYPKDFTPILCMRPDSIIMRPIADISTDVWSAVLPLLKDHT